MPATLRTFVAVPLPDAVRNASGRLQERLRRQGLSMRWVKPGGIHLTLKFLGDVSTDALDGIAAALGQVAADAAPIALRAAGLGVFPGIRNPRVLWMGIQGATDRLIDLAGRVDAGLAACGFVPEKRPFRAHLTLARARSPVDPRHLGEILIAEGGFDPIPFSADAIVLYQSELKPDGAVYTRLATRPLTQIAVPD
jgi:RNA 2',3'-cyclic 3'-phosphodiesterase